MGILNALVDLGLTPFNAVLVVALWYLRQDILGIIDDCLDRRDDR